MKIYEYYTSIERPTAAIFQAMSNRGICVDLEYLSQLRATLENQKSPIEEAIKNELGPINLNSPKQLLKALNEKGIFPTFKGKPSTDKRALSYIHGQPIVEHLLQFSQIETLLSSFIYPYLERGQAVVHPFFNQCGTRTGRLSCSNPNLLQIPKHTENGILVRKMFVPRPGMVLGDCDYGQIEPRVLAHLSKDPTLCEMFNNGVDFHSFTAERLGISRDKAKVLNLSVGYRATFKSVSQQLRCSNEEAQMAIDQWWSLFQRLRIWQDSLIFASKRSGYCTTLMGRRIKVDNLSESNPWKREAAERQIINNITQGSASEVMKMAMIRIQAQKHMFSPAFGLLVQVYDELLFESPEIDRDSASVAFFMRDCVKLDVPLEVKCKTGASWGEVS